MGMIKNAKKNATKAETKTAAKKNAKRQVELEGLEGVAALDLVIKQLTALKDTLGGEVKAEMKKEFVDEGMTHSLRPKNFEGVEGDATASCELRMRSSRSKLTASDIKELEAAGVALETKVTKEETLAINKKYLNDQALLEKVDAACEQIDDLPEDFIVCHEEVSQKVVNEQTLNTLFSLEDKKQVAALFDMVTTLAIKPKMTNEDLAKTLVNEMIG